MAKSYEIVQSSVYNSNGGFLPASEAAERIRNHPSYRGKGVKLVKDDLRRWGWTALLQELERGKTVKVAPQPQQPVSPAAVEAVFQGQSPWVIKAHIPIGRGGRMSLTVSTNNQGLVSLGLAKEGRFVKKLLTFSAASAALLKAAL